MKICAYCGHNNDDDALLCCACGSKEFPASADTSASVLLPPQTTRAEEPRDSESYSTFFLQFIPGGKSKLVFIFAAVAYAWMMESIIAALMRAFRVSASQISDYERHGPLVAILSLLILAPVVESLVLLALVELSRKLSAPGWVQVVAPACILASGHLSGWPAHPLVVTPSFLIQAASYLYWRPSSKRAAYMILVCVHSLCNLIPAISAAAYAIRHP